MQYKTPLSVVIVPLIGVFCFAPKGHDKKSAGQLVVNKTRREKYATRYAAIIVW